MPQTRQEHSSRRDLSLLDPRQRRRLEEGELAAGAGRPSGGRPAASPPSVGSVMTSLSGKGAMRRYAGLCLMQIGVDSIGQARLSGCMAATETSAQMHGALSSAACGHVELWSAVRCMQALRSPQNYL